MLNDGDLIITTKVCSFLLKSCVQFKTFISYIGNYCSF